MQIAAMTISITTAELIELVRAKYNINRETAIKLAIDQDATINAVVSDDANGVWSDWIDVPGNWDETGIPEDFQGTIEIKYRDGQQLVGRQDDWYLEWIQDGHIRDIIRYRKKLK